MQVDVWAVGVLAYELLEGRSPFAHETRQETFSAITGAAPRFPEWMSEGAVDFIRSALNKVGEGGRRRECGYFSMARRGQSDA